MITEEDFVLFVIGSAIGGMIGCAFILALNYYLDKKDFK